jgi:restriction system protein
MTPGEKQTLLEILDELEPERARGQSWQREEPLLSSAHDGGSATLDGYNAERRMMAVLQPLLAAEGYSLHHPPGSDDRGFDATAHRPASDVHQQQNMVIDVRYRRRPQPLTLTDISRFMVATMQQETNRALIVSNTIFSQNAEAQVAKFIQRVPIDIQLLGLDDLRAWIGRLAAEETDLDEEARIIVQSLAREFAFMIAKNARALDRVEWRDLERIIAEIFGGLGFHAELTCSSKDHGKDVILECIARGKRRNYIIEVKHWRSGARVGNSAVREFVDVVAREARDGGVFLSTYGYTGSAFETLTEIERQHVRFGGEEKIAALCRKYTRAAAGLWSPPEVLADIVFEDTE